MEPIVYHKNNARARYKNVETGEVYTMEFVCYKGDETPNRRAEELTTTAATIAGWNPCDVLLIEGSAVWQ